jgi:hypothetical protein
VVNAAFVSDLQNRVPKTSCPSCGKSHLEFAMRCDVGSTECLFVARCELCHMIFGVDEDSFPAGVLPDGDMQPEHLRCARCKQSLVMVTLSCSATSHSCRYALRCPSCDSH